MTGTMVFTLCGLPFRFRIEVANPGPVHCHKLPIEHLDYTESWMGALEK